MYPVHHFQESGVLLRIRRNKYMLAYLYVTYDALTVDSIIYTMSSLYILPLYLAIAMISFFSRVLFQIFGVDIVGKT